MYTRPDMVTALSNTPYCMIRMIRMQKCLTLTAKCAYTRHKETIGNACGTTGVSNEESNIGKDDEAQKETEPLSW